MVTPTGTASGPIIKSAFSLVNGFKCTRLNVHCPRSPYFNRKGTGCEDTASTLWSHNFCGKPDWIDGRGLVHCGCQKPRPLFDLNFVCKTNGESTKHGNLLDLANTLRAMPMALSYDVPEDELD